MTNSPINATSAVFNMCLLQNWGCTWPDHTACRKLCRCSKWGAGNATQPKLPLLMKQWYVPINATSAVFNMCVCNTHCICVCECVIHTVHVFVCVARGSYFCQCESLPFHLLHRHIPGWSQRLHSVKVSNGKTKENVAMKTISQIENRKQKSET